MITKSKGFTLIELLVVIAIIGILASVTLASVSEVRKQSQAARVAMDLKQLEKAIYSFHYENDGSEWFYETMCTQCWKFENLMANTNFGKYLTKKPEPPFIGDYHYDHDISTESFTCGGDVGGGVNIFVEGGGYELYERLEKIFADRGGPTCGRVRFRAAIPPTVGDLVIYMVDDNI